MASFSGKVVFKDLDGGVFELACDDGKRYALAGGPFRDGERVTVEGDVSDSAMGIGMTGAPVLRVKKIAR